MVPVPIPVKDVSTEYAWLLRESLRHDSALSDGSDSNIDHTGGYYYAGDYKKFAFPLSFLLNLISWEAVEYLQGT
ncbi:hypothetical protein BC936DRAFT_136702 [Jimgerdemannia flammicorona]|uniref:cellulase n=1 Tax=Jimgerdemannia flammicorona TaxID=994334 RepID=A0A433CYZ7_9FUNG|nr:hypothetical protein BC936DRAFT_136702 [Jimgerdemannia flammicorona]